VNEITNNDLDIAAFEFAQFNGINIPITMSLSVYRARFGITFGLKEHFQFRQVLGRPFYA
jgi:hypothetical protein